MDFFQLEYYGNRHEFISVRQHFYSDINQKNRIHDWGGYFRNDFYDEPFNALMTDLYSDAASKAHWNRMFAAAPLDNVSETTKTWGDVLGCTGDLIVKEHIRDLLLPLCDQGTTECWQVFLRKKNKVKMPVSYYLVNPRLEVDVLNYAASGFRFHFTESQPSLDQTILDPVKLRKAPPVFRIEYNSYKIVVNDQVRKALEAIGCTNLGFEKLPQQPMAKGFDVEQFKLSTALFSAVKYKEWERARDLIRRGANPDYQAEDGKSVRELLIAKKKEDLLT